jgi:hypothetical protein
VKKEEINLDLQNLLDIDTTKIGVLRVNSKYCYPCDNSIIRIAKNQIGNRRIGTSLIMKDNLVFGIKERNEAFKSKLGNEDELLSREAWFASDRRCDFWLEFENGVKLLVEMVDKTVPHLEEIPLHEPLPPDALNATSISIKQSIYDEGDSGDVPP